MGDGQLSALENVTFPSGVSVLTFESNPIARVSGVVFPASLEYLTLNSNASSGLQEFEVRQTDASLFATLRVFNVSSVTTFSCSDSRAKARYVSDTLLCVLSDDEFSSKYLPTTSKAAAGGINGSTERSKLVETMDQWRSWFLIVSVVALIAVTVGMVALAVWNRERRSGSTVPPYHDDRVPLSKPLPESPSHSSSTSSDPHFV